MFILPTSTHTHTHTLTHTHTHTHTPQLIFCLFLFPFFVFFFFSQFLVLGVHPLNASFIRGFSLQCFHDYIVHNYCKIISRGRHRVKQCLWWRSPTFFCVLNLNEVLQYEILQEFVITFKIAIFILCKIMHIDKPLRYFHLFIDD